MTVYILNILVTFIAGTLFQDNYNLNSKNITLNRSKIPKQLLFLLLIWCGIYGFRGLSVGSDTTGYYYFYKTINRYGSLRLYIQTERDKLFSIVEYITYNITNGNWHVFQLICALLTYFPILKVITKESTNSRFSLLLFIFTTSFYSGFNATRQSIAISISFYAYFFLFKEKKYIKYALLMIISFYFHSTAAFAIPFHILTLKKFKSLSVKMVTIIFVVSFVFLGSVWNSLIDFMNMIGQEKIASDYAIFNQNGANILRLFVFLLPLFLGASRYRSFTDLYSDIDIDLIFMLSSCLFILLSLKFWIFARVSGYFSLITILYIPKLCDVLFSDTSRRTGGFLIGSLYFLFMLLLLLAGEGNIYPYSFYSGVG